MYEKLRILDMYFINVKKKNKLETKAGSMEI